MPRILKRLARSRTVNSKQVLLGSKVVQIEFRHSEHLDPIVLGWFYTEGGLVANVDLEYPFRSVVSCLKGRSTTLNPSLTVFANNKVVTLSFADIWVDLVFLGYRNTKTMEVHIFDEEDARGDILDATGSPHYTGGVVPPDRDGTFWMNTVDNALREIAVGPRDQSRSPPYEPPGPLGPEPSEPVRGPWSPMDLGIYNVSLENGHLDRLGLLDTDITHEEYVGFVYIPRPEDLSRGHVRFRVPGGGSSGSTVIQVEVQPTAPRVTINYNHAGITFTPAGPHQENAYRYVWPRRVTELFRN